MMISSAFCAAIGLTVVASSPAPALAFVPSSLESNHIRSRSSPLTQLSHHQNQYNDRRTFVTSAASKLPIFATAIITTPVAANSITPEQASKSYDTYAETYDNLDGGSIASSLGIDEARKNLLSEAKGDVLEIGVGTGLNLDSYRFDGDNAINSLTLVDISEGMLSQAKLRIQQIKMGDSSSRGISVKFVQADATSELVSLFGENKFDTVVDTFSLCVMGNEGAKRCLEEMTGVVKKSGQILLIENTRASNPILGYYQDITASTAADMGGKGCLYNQNVGEMIRQTKGLQLAKEVTFAAGLFRSFTCQKI